MGCHSERSEESLFLFRAPLRNTDGFLASLGMAGKTFSAGRKFQVLGGNEEDGMIRNAGGTMHIFPFAAHAVILAMVLAAAITPSASAQAKPKVRSITAFIR